MAKFELTTNDGRTLSIEADTPELARKAFDHGLGAQQPPPGVIIHDGKATRLVLAVDQPQKEGQSGDNPAGWME